MILSIPSYMYNQLVAILWKSQSYLNINKTIQNDGQLWSIHQTMKHSYIFLEFWAITTTYCAFLRRAKWKTWKVCETKTKNLKGLRSKNNLPYLRCNMHRNLWCTTHH
jgi:hypothetical protein